ncbi:hypothetical protein [Agromyces cerinus]|uniref:Uncharacterized protein n=1 Tax=Agromyces cerinus subsp. cerinus TaxID=232089 RepID=A0A1N6H7C2_9MICO|nr:hypothetical protein [Agromyces cerinus]SIO15684.1 hypothetical protein SAMN05443544_2951 [Agromyces cerinus subsp. cerinus]
MTRPSPAADDQRIALIQKHAIRAFRAAGVDGPVVPDPGDALNTSIRSTAGAEYGLANLTLTCLSLPRWRWRRQIRNHVASIVAGTADQQPFDLTDPEIRVGLRSRLMPENGLPWNLDYARRIAPGLLEVLCVDLPATVGFVSDESIAGHDAEALFALGRSQLQFERIDAREEIAPGLTALVGESFFVASRVLDPRFMAAELEGAPRGVAFFAPGRSELFIAPISGAESVEPITALARLASRLDPASRPGSLSGALYFTDGTQFQRISDVGEDGELAVIADGPFLDAINA